MTEVVHYDVTCDKCGNDIDPDSGVPYWSAHAQNTNPTHWDYLPLARPVRRLDICMECIWPVFGELLLKASPPNRPSDAPNMPHLLDRIVTVTGLEVHQVHPDDLNFREVGND